MTPTCQYNEGHLKSEVREVECTSIEEQGSKIAASIRLQLKAYPDELIGVFCPLKEDVASLKAILSEEEFASQMVVQDSDEGYLPFEEDSRICLSTLHSAKGLEFRAAHFAGVDGLSKFRDRERRMAFTGVTRAKTTLSVYHSGGIPPFLKSAIAATSPRTGKPNLKDLMGEG